jgi:hypothetical protein
MDEVFTEIFIKVTISSAHNTAVVGEEEKKY